MIRWPWQRYQVTFTLCNGSAAGLTITEKPWFWSRKAADRHGKGVTAGSAAYYGTLWSYEVIEPSPSERN